MPSRELSKEPRTLPKGYSKPYLSAGLLPGVASAAGDTRFGKQAPAQSPGTPKRGSAAGRDPPSSLSHVFDTSQRRRRRGLRRRLAPLAC
ncbi:hypothetical protein PG985_010863 [Apiospora marii]|uniref:uncharacterized protein n=1 Tax=Apiospora marii TaxID=335849 RepID=UPI003131C33F